MVALGVIMFFCFVIKTKLEIHIKLQQIEVQLNFTIM